jgi:hypothetical protein
MGGVKTECSRDFIRLTEVVCVSVYDLNRAIHAIYINRDNTIAFRNGQFDMLARFDLSSEEHTAIVERDFPKLWSFHVHPIILFHLSAVLNPREWYMANVAPKIVGVPNQFYDYYLTAEETEPAVS